jgi:hypothetical protein
MWPSVSPIWWGVLNTTLYDQVCLLSMVRCTKYNLMWPSLSLVYGEVYLIQPYVIKFVSCLLWGVLDTTLCDQVCLLSMVRCTKYNLMWSSLSPVWWGVLNTTLCDHVCLLSMVRCSKYNLMWPSLSPIWWGVLNTTLCDQVCLLSMVRCTKYNIIWSSLSPVYVEVY